ncbi:MAG: hypothetical protein JST32_20140 [Bacteroidetes bacterium]|nr:hypothetical protein [Bacteroidota bacterium]
MKTSKSTFLIIALAPMAVAGHVYAYQQADTAKIASAKVLPVQDDNEKNKPNAYQLFGHGDATLDSLSKKISYYSSLMRAYEQSKAYETLKIRAKGFTKPTPTFYNNDTLRHIMAALDNISKYFTAQTNRHLELKRDSLGTLLGDYFKTPKFIAINTRLQKKYHIDPAKNYGEDDANYREYHNELLKKMPASAKDNLQQLKRLSEEWREEIQSPQYLAYIKQLPVLIDSMKNYYKKPHVAQYSYASYEATMDVPAAERKKAQDELVAYHHKPEYQHAHDMLLEYSEKMRDYYKKTPAVKDREDAWKSELKTILADDYDTIVHPAHGLDLQ